MALVCCGGEGRKGHVDIAADLDDVAERRVTLGGCRCEGQMYVVPVFCACLRRRGHVSERSCGRVEADETQQPSGLREVVGACDSLVCGCQGTDPWRSITRPGLRMVLLRCRT